MISPDLLGYDFVRSVTLIFRYDSKSVKLAPEASYTAPPVSTHSVTATGTTNVIIKPNKTRDEGTPAEGEAEEVLLFVVLEFRIGYLRQF